MTNREWLESLSDKELAKIIDLDSPCGICNAENGNCHIFCADGVEAWLKAKWNGAEWNGKERIMKRGEAIKILTEIQTKHKKYIGQTECNNALNMAIEALQQEPVKRGTWTITETHDCEGGGIPHLICSECKSEPMAWSSKQFFNYCPNCGAKMKGTEE